MEYVMNDREKIMYTLIHDQGVKETVLQMIRASIELGHTMSDLRVKERALKLMEAADALKESLDKIDD